MAPKEAVYPPMLQAKRMILSSGNPSLKVAYCITASIASCSCSGNGFPLLPPNPGWFHPNTLTYAKTVGKSKIVIIVERTVLSPIVTESLWPV